MNFVRQISNVLTIETGQTITVWRGTSTPTDKKIFAGYIEKYEPDAGKVRITGKDKLWDLVRKNVTKIYESTDGFAGKISAIFLDLVTTYGGLTADGTTVQDSGTVYILTKFMCNHTDVFERCKALATALDWQFYYNPITDKVYFEPSGFTDTGTTITVGTEIIGMPKWNYDNTELVNDVTVIGATQEVETTETGQIGVTSGYTTTGIDLSQVPNSVKLYADVSNPPTTLRTGGVTDVTGTFYYSVNRSEKKIIPYSGTTFTNAWYFEIRYSLLVPVPINMYNQLSIDAYGKFEKTITYKDIKSVADAENRALNYLDKYSTPFIYSTLKVKAAIAFDLKIGDKITVVDSISIPNVNTKLDVNRIVMNYPAAFDEVYIGDKEWRLAEWQSRIEEKIKRLEEEEENQEIVTNLISIDNSISQGIEVQPRYTKVTTKAYNVGNNVLIWGDADHDTWGSFNWGNDATAFDPEVNHFIKQYLNIYTEDFGDDDFKD